jgi:aldehyde:ferredoxin oxidoreductase
VAKYAVVDLNTRTVTEDSIDPALLLRWLGGRGLGAWELMRRTTPATDPDGPDNAFILSVGPLTGTPWPTGARYHATFRSPLTGIYGYANGGGHFGAALAGAGWDLVIIVGQAAEPVYLDVRPHAIEILPAGHLWGKTTDVVHELLLQGAPQSRVACIGPAGERGVRYAAIINDHSRAAARCGGGAVLGSKRCKAIVVRDAEPRRLPRPFLSLAKAASQRLRETLSVQGLRSYGTPVLMAPKNASGDLPANNHQQGQVPYIRQIDAEALERKVVRRRGCHSCPIQCDHVTRSAEGKFFCEIGGPEYETLDALGPLCGVGDLDAIIYANKLCNDWGLDTISTGVVIAFAMECRQRGLLADHDLSLEWGDVPSLLGLIDRIALRQGIGELLSEGVARAARSLGTAAEPLAMQVKGMEIPRQEPRIAKGFGLGHAVSNRGADHLYALPTIDVAGSWEVARKLFPADRVAQLMDTADETFKPDLVAFSEHYCAVSDALGVCKFSTAETYGLYPEDLAAGLSALWDHLITSEELLLAGERIVNLERMYNVRLGLSRRDDTLPTRFTAEPLDVYSYKAPPGSTNAVRSAEPIRHGALLNLQPMLDRYYQLRGWDSAGRPTQSTLKRLGLDEFASILSVAFSEHPGEKADGRDD